ncbi:DNA-binding response regulator [Shewanella sp. Choline-02u-19]|jgi:DNA-binding NarL/FixJ family response regulator|uniref:helix-turn-helix transcriptional regulator n=1 Tax=unclassified Shewanella TaxID=196818 RepID=UPI000C334A05|nr:MULTISPECIES: response regulator transcription factor [unclassified Shewanella]PKG55254.1 DNA-binding response regulator [Shewanella sp. GutDb-MelDb]PKG73596.1 DNA-binding response regulator [Shewanella sp. GutCb]PKH55637.1 DNA-binding response regulator [Shewanella sp. Bg11-22]PKI29889.1 DNA-binding response regulator [Shewanella sp. Choline-02u-19]
MSKIDELVFIHQVAAPCHLAILADSIGIKTRVIKKPSDLVVAKDCNRFYMVAQKGTALDSKGIPIVAARLVSQFPIALYQVERDSLDPKAALLLGIKGLLYADQGMDLLLTGLKKMVANELWYERGLLSEMFSHLMKRLDSNNEVAQDQDTIAMLQMLTNRERTVIQLVSSGARNKEIAHQLCISEHTVKAHISSIFRKTQSRNRVELLRWAQTYQSQFELCS